MFKFWYEKFLFRFSFIFAFCAFLGVFVYAYFTEIMIKLPGEKAPFSETLIEDSTDSVLPEQRSLPLEKQHRTNKELQNWTSMAVSESLSFDKESFSNVSQTIRAYFTDEGFQQYQNYLLSSGIIESIKKNDYRMSIFIEEKPLLLNGSTIQNIYRWLYQLPVTLSFLPRNAANLIGRGDMVNRKMTLRIQVRRVKLPDNPNAIQIESWTMAGRR